MITPTHLRVRGRSAGAFLAAIVLVACGGPTGDATSRPTALPLLTLAGPAVEIGVVEGNADYTFASVDAVQRLADASIAVSDAGSTRISIYDGRGSFVRSWGTRGEGPGEFRSLSRIYRHGSDSIMAADAATARLSVFGLDGEYARRVDGVELSRDSTFRLDSWLYGRLWVDGALTATERAALEDVIDRLPPPRGVPGYRRGIVTREGGLLLREADVPAASGADPRTLWTLLDPTGRPVAAVETPSRFTPMDIGEDEILGRWLGPADVAFVRVYPITETDETRPVPAWLQGSPAPAAADTGSVAADAGPTDEEFRTLMRESIRGMAMAQEIHYSEAFTYTTALDSLERFDPPEGLGVSFTHATPRGWAAVFTHPTADRLCGLAYGAGGPPGWQAGAIHCGRPSSPPARGS